MQPTLRCLIPICADLAAQHVAPTPPKPIMTSPNRFYVLCAVAVALLAGCQTPGANVQEQEQQGADAACVVTQAGFQRIYDQHCTATAGGSQLLPKYCTSPAAAQNFCRMVQNAPNRIRITQADGRIRYDANLGMAVGTAGGKCARLIIDPAADGSVISASPVSSGGPGACR